jgi:tetratricopeptide (TPR) repeat protein
MGARSEGAGTDFWAVSAAIGRSPAPRFGKGVAMSGVNPGEQRAQAFFKTGNDAAMKNNFDYAIQMYQEACKLVPDNLLYRQALRGIERRKFGNLPAKVGRLVGARVQPIRLRARTAKAKGQWGHVLEVCEEAFAYNPWDVSVSEEAAEAAERLGYREVAQWLLESVVAQANDAGFFRHLAHVYELGENWQKAIQCWERVKKINPNDEEAGRQINSLSANATIARSGLGDAIDKSSQGPSGPESFAPDPEELKRLAMAPEERWKKEIQDAPDRAKAYLELADHYKMHDRLDDAEKVLALAMKNIPGDSYVQMAHSEVQISRLHKRIDHYTRKAQADPTDADAKSKVEQLNRMLGDYEVKEFRRRLALRPDDMNLRYQLGLRLAKAGQHDAAIAEFQQARNVAALRVKALYQTGLSFEANGVLKLAERSFVDALKAVETTEPDNQEMLNDLHYRLGRVAESQGNLKAAEDHYNEVAANDYGYLDVAQRLRNLNLGPSS